MKKLILLSVVYWFFVLLLIYSIRTGKGGTINYNSGKVYKTSVQLFYDIVPETLNGKCFQWCCNLTQFYANSFGFTYEEINIALFVIFQPALMIFFLLTTIYLFFKKVSN